jgi:hypothetical protein
MENAETRESTGLFDKQFVFVGFKVFTAVTMKNAIFWDVARCRSCVNRRFGGTPVHARSTWRHITEDGFLQFVFC